MSRGFYSSAFYYGPYRDTIESRGTLSNPWGTNWGEPDYPEAGLYSMAAMSSASGDDGWSLAESASAASLADSLSTTSISLLSTTSVSLTSVAATSSLFESTRTGGPSFESYSVTPTSSSYDSSGRLTSLTDANLGVTSFTYDAAGNLASLTDPVSNTTTWVYDDQNRAVQETDELSNSTSCSYDSAGNLARYTDANGQIRQYDYDSAGNVSGETWYATTQDAENAQNVENTIHYERDYVGRITAEWDSVSSVVYVYSDAGQITSTTQSSVDGPTVTLTYQYDADGNRTQMAAIIDGTPDFVDDYVYDSLGRVVSVVEHGVEGGNAVTSKEIDLVYNDSDQIVSLDRYQDGQLAV